MLDDEKANAARVELANARGNRLDQHRIDARERLVEQDELGFDHERTAKLQQFFLSARQAARRDVGDLNKTQKFEGFMHPFRVALFFDADLARPGEQVDEFLACLAGCSHHKVLSYGQMAEFAGDLECAHHAGARPLVWGKRGYIAAVEHDGADIGRLEARDDREQRRLAGTVGAYDAKQRASSDLQRHVVEGAKTTE